MTYSLQVPDSRCSVPSTFRIVRDSEELTQLLIFAQCKPQPLETRNLERLKGYMITFLKRCAWLASFPI